MNWKKIFLHIATLILTVTMSQSSMAESLGPISEEKPPAVCDPGSFIKKIKCSGKYCDNIQIYCSRVGDAVLGSAIWTNWVSEERGGSRNCPSNSYIAGLACKGKYCDNISLYCVQLKNYRPLDCRRTNTISEERGGILHFFQGDKSGQRFVARGIKCSGKYCDNKSFDVCEIGR